ncbi:MAG: ATP-binding protein [Gemmatimonadales bacterium]|nr:ATP-binding protein [Gemmatimonadales bacterium]
MLTTEQVLALIALPEAEHLECKAARTTFNFDELARYVSALANEGGGVMLFGVSDKRPRVILGTRAFDDPGRTSATLYAQFDIHVPISEHAIEGKRVLAVEVPRRPFGSAVSCRGAYWMRAGESLVPMSDERLREIHQEGEPDFSAELCPGLVLDDLSPIAVEVFRRRWIIRSGNPRLEHLPSHELLADAGLVTGNGGVTYAALLLLGTPAASARHLAAAEIVYEYRSAESAGPAQARIEFRQGFLLTSDELWESINARNDRQSIQEGFFRREIATFDEQSIREAVLNAVAHRDYRSPRSVFLTQYPRRLEVVSPGGLPPGVTPDNILNQQHPRNRLLAEAMGKIGLVERAGQGVNLMFERSLQQGKQLPDFAGSSPHEVRLVLDGVVSNPALLATLEQIGAETLQSFAIEDFLVLDRLQRGEEVPAALRTRAATLHELGLIERSGRGRSVRYFLSRRLASAIGQKGTLTRRRGLDRAANKALLIQHLESAGDEGANLPELQQVLHTLSKGQVQDLLQSLKAEKLIVVRGTRRWGRWFHVEPPSDGK